MLDPADPYSTGQFFNDVTKVIKQIHSKQRIPLLVGGTMLYFHALQNGIAALSPAKDSVRQTIIAQAATQGWDALYDELQRCDPKAAARIHPNDPQRLLRALEVYRITGQPISTEWETAAVEPPAYRFINLILMPEDRAVLHDRIARRFDVMLQAGFVNEVIRLYTRGDLYPDMPSIRTVGYRQVWAYLNGEMDVVKMRERAIIATRQLAKRQMTWLRRWRNAKTFIGLGEQVYPKVLNFLKNSCL